MATKYSLMTLMIENLSGQTKLKFDKKKFLEFDLLSIIFELIP